MLIPHKYICEDCGIEVQAGLCNMMEHFNNCANIKRNIVNPFDYFTKAQGYALDEAIKDYIKEYNIKILNND